MTKKTKGQFFDVIVIGAGASGTTAAIFAAKRGARVLILEHKEKLGKKILATGNGKCNFTNLNMKPEFFHGDDRLIGLCMDSFTKDDAISFFESIGIRHKDKNGYVYPNSEQASSVAQALEMAVKRHNITVKYNVTIDDIDDGLTVYTSEGQFCCRSLIIASGLKANPKLGSDGSMFDIIKGLGHRFTPVVPALCGFYCSGMDFKLASGVRADGCVKAIVDGKILAEDRGEIQFADYGLSGIPVFQISRYLSMGLYNKRSCQIEFSLFPDMSVAQIKKLLTDRLKLFHQGDSLGDFFNGFINSKLASAILKKCHLDMKSPVGKLSDDNIISLAQAMGSNVVNVDKWRDFEFAQVCAGGIRTDEIHGDTLGSKLVANLHFAGEILDVDGICGGYNLQWAWTSGYIAGNSVKI